MHKIPSYIPQPLLFSLTSIGIAATLLCSCGKKDETRQLILTGSSTCAPMVADMAKRFEESHPGTRIDVQSGGSSRGIADATSGLADIGMISRNLKEGEDLTPHRMAMDGVCVIVHQDNPVENLTKQQVIDIYTGKIENWKDVGGADKAIVVANKAEGRATLEVFLGYTGLDNADIQADIVVGENQQAIKTAAGNPNAISYVSIGEAAYEAEHGTPIKLIQADGLAPTTGAVANGSFPITRPLQLVTKGEATGLAKEFIDYATSEEVHDLVEKHLFVPAGN